MVGIIGVLHHLSTMSHSHVVESIILSLRFFKIECDFKIYSRSSMSIDSFYIEKNSPNSLTVIWTSPHLAAIFFFSDSPKHSAEVLFKQQFYLCLCFIGSYHI